MTNFRIQYRTTWRIEIIDDKAESDRIWVVEDIDNQMGNDQFVQTTISTPSQENTNGIVTDKNKGGMPSWTL